MESYDDWKKKRGGAIPARQSLLVNNDPLSSFESFKAAKSRGVDVNSLAKERARLGMAEAESALKKQQSDNIQLKPEALTASPRKSSQGDFMAGLSAYIPQTKQLLAGAVTAVGDAVGSERLRKWGLSKYRAAEEEIKPFSSGRPTSLEDIHGVRDAIDYAQYNLGNLAGSAMESMGAAAAGSIIGSSVPGVGTAVGATSGFLAKTSVKKFVTGYVEKQIAKGVTKEVAEKGAEKALQKKVSAGIGMFASSYVQGVGDVYGETMDENGKGSAATAFIGALPYAALDTIADISVLDKVFKGSEGEKALRRYAASILSGGLKEGSQETAQEIDLLLAGLANGKEYSTQEVLSRLANSFVAAGLGGAVAGIPGGRKSDTPVGSLPTESTNTPIAPVEGDLQSAKKPTQEPKKEDAAQQETSFVPKYEAKKNVNELFSALESEDTASVDEISSKMSNQELKDSRAILEEMQNNPEVLSNPDVLEKISSNVEMVDSLIEKKREQLSQEANNVIEGKPSENTLHISDANTVKDIVVKASEALDEKTKEKVNENIAKLDTNTLPGVNEARALVNENNPFSSLTDDKSMDALYEKKASELDDRLSALDSQKSDLLGQKQSASSRDEKIAIQRQIDDIDSERHSIDADFSVLEDQALAKQLVSTQDTIDKIRSIEPNFNVAKTVNENWSTGDYTKYFEGINKQSYESNRKTAKPRSRELSSSVRVEGGKPRVPVESPSKYAEEAMRNSRPNGDKSGERPSDGRKLLKKEAQPVKQEKNKVAEKKLSKEDIEALAMSKNTFSEEEKSILATYEGAGATRAAGRGILDEFFTPQVVVDKMWSLVKGYFGETKGLKILEPSAGTGRFISGAPEGSNVDAFETNPVSAKIASVLNPDAKVDNVSFETIFVDEKGKKKSFAPIYDVVIGNPPYGEHRGKYKGLGEEPKIGRYEEYFLKRALDITKEDGIVAMVVPSGFLRGSSSTAKRAISNMAYLVDAYRLPNGSFKGTDVGTDIVVFHKKEAYKGTATLSQITNDAFFKNYPEKILGKEGEKKGRFGMEKAVEGSLENAISKISVDRASAKETVTEEVSANTEKIEEERALPEEKQLFDVFESFFGLDEAKSLSSSVESGSKNTEIKNEKSWQDSVIDEVINESRAFDNSDLEAGYKEFVSIFKNKKARNPKVRDAMVSGDYETMKKEVSRLGIMSASDFSHIFHSESQSESDVFDSFKERLEKESSDAIYGKRIAKSLGKTKDEAIKQGVEAQLKPKLREIKPEREHIKRDEKRPYVLTSTKKGGVQIIEQVDASDEERYLYENTQEDGSIDPGADFDKESANLFNGKYYADINYASGNIYEKLSALEKEKDSMSKKQYDRQKSLLDSVLPKRMSVNDISIIPISETAKIRLGDKSLVDRFSEWLNTIPNVAFEGSNKYQIAGYINGEPVNVGDKARNREIRKKRRDIGNKLFQKFYREDLQSEYQKKLEDKFNEENNSVHMPNYAEYPFSSQLSNTFAGRPLELRPIQIEGASFLVNKGVGVLAYEVGVGKTLSAVAAISEVMRRGWAKRPLIVVPKNLRSKWIREIADSIPGIKINDLGNLGADLKFKGDMKDFSIDDNSLSIITEEGFKRIGYGEDTFSKLTKGLQDVTFEKGEKSDRMKASEAVKVEETAGRAKRGTEFPLTFEELGFDHITFDEAHREKNVFSKAQASKSDRKANEYGLVRGSVSERGLKAYLATQYILSENNGRNVFLLTATPFNNSPVEIYSMLSLVAKKRLEDMGIKNINDFISLYIQLETKLAFKANGTYKETDQVRKFQNLKQLQMLVREYIDFRTGEEAGIPRPTKIRKKQFVKMNKIQWDAVQSAQALFNDKDAGVLKAIAELQKITLSPYLSRYSKESIMKVSPKEFIENSPKIKYTVEAIKKVHKANRDAGQIVFVEKGVEVFTPMMQHFVKDLKYKPNEVAIMDGSVSEPKRDEIKDRFQNGEIKILMTTIKEGVDLQKNSTDLYNLYLPWNPTDLVQIEGRTWRQGSLWDKVRIHYPLLENSVDVFLFQKLEEKAARLASVFSYKGNELDVSDIDFEAMKLDLITDPILRAEAEYSLKLTKVENEISRLSAEKAFIERKAGDIAKINEDISEYSKQMDNLSGDPAFKDTVAYYDRKISSLKENLSSEISRLRKNGVDIDEITKNINEKDQEILLASSKRESLLKEKEAKIAESKNSPGKDVYGDTNFDELTNKMDDAGFFVSMPGAFYNRATRGSDGKFTGSTPKHPDSISSKDIKTYISYERAKQIKDKIKKETNPAIAGLLQFSIAKQILTDDPSEDVSTLGFFKSDRMEITMSQAQSEEHFTKVLRHEIRHAAFVLLPRDKQILIENWYKKLYQEKDKRTLISFFNDSPGDFYRYEEMSNSGEIFEWDGETPTDPTTFMADEAFNRFMDSRGERTALQKMMDKMILAIYRLLSRINSAMFSEKRDRKELEVLYDKVFSQKQGVFNVPPGMLKMLRDKFIIPGRQTAQKGTIRVSTGRKFSQNLFGEETPEQQEKKRIYMQAFEKVLAEKRPPSLGKMVEEAFTVKERRTMITAEKLQSIAETIEDFAMEDGMQAGYLEGETSAVLAREDEIKALQVKLGEVQHMKDRADEVKEDLNNKSYDRLKALVSLQRKMERQSIRYSKQKESLLKKFSEKKSELKDKAKMDVKEAKQLADRKAKALQGIREEMYTYVKDHLPRKNWDKYLRFIRDAKNSKSLQRLFESVDEDVKKIQRASAIRRIKKILEKAENLPIQYQMMIKKITEGINWENTIPSTIKKLSKIDEYLKNNPEAETSMPMRILRRLRILSKESYKKLSTEQLLGLNAKLELIQHVGRIAMANNKAILAKTRMDKLAMIQRTSTNFDVFKHSGLTQEERDKITIWEKGVNSLQTVEFQLMPMDYFVYALDGKNERGTIYQLIKKPIDDGFNLYWEKSNEIKKSLFEFIDKMKSQGLEFTDSMWDRIGIHAIRAQKGGTAKLIASGYTQENIDSVVLDEKELAMYGYLRQELDNLFPAIKEVYQRVYNKELEGVSDYFPFLMDWSNRAPVYEELEAQYNNKKGVSDKGFTIKRVGGGNPVRVNALEAFLKHIDQATYFVSLEEAVRDVQSLISSHRYKEAVGEKAQAYTQRWLEVVERHGVPVDDKQVAFFDALRRNITLGTLAFKITTIPIQLGAIFNGAAMIGKSAFTGFQEIVTSKEARSFVMEASQQMVMRVGDSPEYTEDIPTDRKGAVGRKVSNALNTAREYGMWAVKKVDLYTAAGVWLGAYKKRLEILGEEFDMQNVNQDARDYADMVARMTQGSNEFKDMPPALAQKYRTFGKLLLQFQNFSLFQWNFARQIVGKNISTDKSKAAWQASMIAANIIFAMEIRALVSRGIWGAPPDDEEGMISAFLWELTQQIPLLGSQFYNLEQFMKNPTYYSAGNWQTGVVAFDKSLEAVQSIPKVFANQKEKTREKNMVKAGEAIGNVTGIPGSTQMSQIWRSFLTK